MTKETSTDSMTVWFSHYQRPTRVGYYEVRNDPDIPKRGLSSKQRLTGNRRYWDGQGWLQYKGGPSSIMGSHTAHQWRGFTEQGYMARASHLEKAMARTGSTTSLEL